MKSNKGYIQVYTGNGKGKTTAAFGLALRAIGSGKKVFIGQFIKRKDYGEVISTKQFLKDITVRQYGKDCFIFNEPTIEDINAAYIGLREVKSIINSSEYDLVILDEVNIALYYNLISLNEILDLIEKKPKHVELLLTGRYAPEKLIEAADLVTEMKEIKHYYSNGIKARKGIDF